MKFTVFTFINLLSIWSLAAIKTETVTYTYDKTVMEGYVAYDDTAKEPKPGVLIVHDWMGLTQFTKDKAEQLAKEGYVAFAADVYGKGVRPKDAAEAGALATQFKSDLVLLRGHTKAAFEKLKSMNQTLAKKIVVMGYCFGGTAALELARSGVPLVGTASFHGGLATPRPEDAKFINGRVLVMHGADDPYVPAKEVKAFKEEMKAAKVNMKFISYPGAVHAFSIPTAGTDKSKGAAYNAKADKESWIAFEKFLKEVIK